jgi:peptide/nickel transport system permease protein
VSEVLGRVFPNTVLLGASALAIEFCLGIALAAFVFLFDGQRIENLFSQVLLILYTVPSFWIGLMLLLVFSYGLGWLPSTQMYSSGEEKSFGDLLSHLILPAFTLAIPSAAGIARYLRSSVKSVMHQEYVLAAHAMGISKRSIFRSYILPNSISPMIALMGIEIGILLTGVLVTERIFSWPGMGSVTVDAILSRDYPLILGCTLVAGAVVIGGNFLADLVNAIIDPRIRQAE